MLPAWVVLGVGRSGCPDSQRAAFAFAPQQAVGVRVVRSGVYAALILLTPSALLILIVLCLRLAAVWLLCDYWPFPYFVNQAKSSNFHFAQVYIRFGS